MNNKQPFYSKHKAIITIMLIVVLAILLALLVGLYFDKKIEKLKSAPAVKEVVLSGQLYKRIIALNALLK